MSYQCKQFNNHLQIGQVQLLIIDPIKGFHAYRYISNSDINLSNVEIAEEIQKVKNKLETSNKSSLRNIMSLYI